MTLARDLGTGPTRRFGSALGIGRTPPIPLITERPIRPRINGAGRCPHCGSRFFGCCEKDLEE